MSKSLFIKCPYCKHEQTIKFSGDRKLLYCKNKDCHQLFAVLWDLKGGRVFKLSFDDKYEYSN